MSAFAPAASGKPGGALDAAAALKPGPDKASEEGSGELAAQRAEFAEWADESGSEAARAGSGLGWASDVIQVRLSRTHLGACETLNAKTLEMSFTFVTHDCTRTGCLSSP